jgi:predicted small secreted protein
MKKLILMIVLLAICAALFAYCAYLDGIFCWR